MFPRLVAGEANFHSMLDRPTLRHTEYQTSYALILMLYFLLGSLQLGLISIAVRPTLCPLTRTIVNKQRSQDPSELMGGHA